MLFLRLMLIAACGLAPTAASGHKEKTRLQSSEGKWEEKARGLSDKALLGEELNLSEKALEEALEEEPHLIDEGGLVQKPIIAEEKRTVRCPSGYWKCPRNTRCVRKQWLCDGDNDCGDWTDEVICWPFGCARGQFRCSFGGCCPGAWLCNGHNNCPDGGDETQCVAQQCQTGQFGCPDKCIPSSKLCDGVNDCGDNSDETDCRPAVCRPLLAQ